MKTAEDQIWDRARQIEQSRVLAQHQKMQRDGKISKAEYSPGGVRKPWIWGSSAANSLHDLDPELVFSVKDFDFDLNNEGFVLFLRKRYHLHMCRAHGSAYWNALNDHSFTKENFLISEVFQFAQEYNGMKYKYNNEELLVHWNIFHFTKVFMQGAYDRFQGRTE